MNTSSCSFTGRKGRYLAIFAAQSFLLLLSTFPSPASLSFRSPSGSPSFSDSSGCSCMYWNTTSSPYLFRKSTTCISLNLDFWDDVVFASSDFSFALNIICRRCSAGMEDMIYSYLPLNFCPVRSIRPLICTSSLMSLWNCANTMTL